MIGIKVKNTFLKLFASTNFSFEQSNTAYLGDKMEVIPNGLIYSVDVPSEYPNDELLEYPYLVDNNSTFLKNEPCEIYKNGRCIFIGYLTVKKAIKGNITVSIAINTIAELKNTKLRDLDLGSFNIDADESIMRNFYTDTVHNPSNHNFICHPVWNKGIVKEESISAVSENNHQADEFQNLYEKSETHPIGQVIWRNRSIITPFLKLSHVLKQCFAEFGYNFYNEFQSSKELEQITLYGNASVYAKDGSINASIYYLNESAPSGTAADLLARLTRLYGLQLDVNVFTKTARLVPFKKILNTGAFKDWTHKLVKISEVSENTNYPTVFSFKRGDDWLLPSIDELNKLTRYNSTNPTVGTSFGDVSPTGLYPLPVLSNRFQYWYTNPEDFLDFKSMLAILHDSVNIGGTESQWESELQGLVDTYVNIEEDNTRNAFTPGIKHKLQLRPNSEDCAMRLMMYRGMRENADGFIYPLSTAEDFTMDGTSVKVGWDVTSLVSIPALESPTAIQNTLTWEGSKGIYTQFWAPIIDFLKRKKDVTAQFYLSVDDLITFNFADKIRVKNMEYFIKKMRGTLKSAGDGVLVECDLVSVS